jgi:hypothetical protein
MHVVVNAADLKRDSAEAADNSTHVLMKSWANFSIDHLQARFCAENDVKEQICICHSLWANRI